MSKFVLASVLIVPIAFGQIALTTAQIAKRVSPSVVVIQGKTDSGDVLGSGFIVSKDGKIVTNLHVIRDMKTVNVQLANGEAFDSVSVLAIDERRDLAIVQIAGFNLSALELGNSDVLTVGEPLVIVGSPRGLEGTVTAGILSSVRDSGEGFKVLQTDAAVNPGNSGGPLANTKGQAIGVVSFKLRSAEGLNFAMPINYVRGLLNTLHEPMSLEQMRRGLVGKTPAAEKSGGPSLKETLDWSKEKLPLGPVHYVLIDPSSTTGTTYSVTDQSNVWSFDSCTVVFGTVSTLTPNSQFNMVPIVSTTRFTLPLGVLTVGTVAQAENPPTSWGTFVSGERWAYRLTLMTKEIISVALSSSGPRSISDSMTTNRVSLTFNDESLAQRVLQAFSRAAALCRGKEPF